MRAQCLLLLLLLLLLLAPPRPHPPTAHPFFVCFLNLAAAAPRPA
jgi:hypothetical protein